MGKRTTFNSNIPIGIQLLLWTGFALLIVMRLRLNHDALEVVLITSSTLILGLVIVYGHVFLALKHLLGANRNYVRYFLGLISVLLMSQAINFLSGYFFFCHMGFDRYEPKESFELIFIWNLVETLAFIMVSTPVKFTFDYFRLRSAQSQIENERLNAELRYLKLQISPHFLFNTLNNLYYLAENKSDNTSLVVQKLADLMRYLLSKDSEEFVTLEQEIEMIQAYIELEKIRIKSIDVSMDIDGDIQNISLPPALLIILVENAFKHGVDKTLNDNYVFIELKIEAGALCFQVENPLRENNGNNSGNAIGLENLRKRLQLQYPDRFAFSLSTENYKFIAKLKLDL
ncbi:MAG: histidine kinase [Cyclobacteriaceae bacterium]|nr:histidine kinase [Cyclobacteriaceae bacterium HetDA_MAG_MS6]